MKFLNKKQDVIDIELTSYGKYLLSTGKFSPEYYSFFDTNIVYDIQYVGVVEAQNSSHDRIKDTPTLEAQSIFSGVETEIVKYTEAIRQGHTKHAKIQPTPEKHYSLVAPIGTISLTATSAPSWNVKVMEGAITGSVSYKQGEHQLLKIPQLTFKDLEFQTIAKKQSEEEKTDLGLVASVFKDGSYIDVSEDAISIYFEEENTDFVKDNFEIEVYEVGTETVGGVTKELFTPLYFCSQEPVLIRNGILLEEHEIEKSEVEIDPSCVEYFFEVLVDDEVEDVEIKRDLYSTTVREEDLNC